MQEGKDYYINKNGLLTFTAHYLQQRGYCCGNGCMHCPYEYERVQEPRRKELLAKRNQNSNANKE